MSEKNICNKICIETIEQIGLDETTKYLMTLDPYYDYTDEELDKIDALTEKIINQYTWPVVYQKWSSYLYNNCPTEENVIRFAHSFFCYGSKQFIPDPLRFISYFYYRVDVTKNQDAFDIFDSLAITILPNAGLVNMMEEPCYAAETDPRIQAEIANWKRNEKQGDKHD